MPDTHRLETLHSPLATASAYFKPSGSSCDRIFALALLLVDKPLDLETVLAGLKKNDHSVRNDGESQINAV